MIVNDRIVQEVEKILNDSRYPHPLNIAMAACWIIINFKGTQVKLMDTKHISSLADYFILANTDNPMQAMAISESLSFYLKKNDISIRGREGSRESDWLLIDLGDLIIHLFMESARNVYSLDSLWKEAKVLPIPEEFYFDSIRNKGQETKADSLEDYI